MPASPEAGLLRQRGTLRDQGTVSADPEANLCSDPRLQATTLLPRPPYHGGLIISLG